MNTQPGPTFLAEAMRWVSRLTAVSIEMILPGLLGLWLDHWLGSVVVFTLVGFAGGFTLGLLHLIRLTDDDRPPSDEEPTSGHKSDVQRQ